MNVKNLMFKEQKNIEQEKQMYSDDAGVRKIKLNSPDHNLNYQSNYIRTTKYTFYNFIFLALAYQFLRFQNCYFLLITVLVLIDAISPTSPIPTINAMLFVIIVSMVREGHEDYGRYKQDKV
jgi:hypothetical protein